jgi:SLOG cluster4 family
MILEIDVPLVDQPGGHMAIIGVMGSGRNEWPELATPLGTWIAAQGFDLLTGAGCGVMLSTARAYATTPGPRGRSIGIVPSKADPVLGFVPIAGYPNPFIDLPVVTPLPRKEAGAPDDALSRNYVNVLTSDIVVALGRDPPRDALRETTDLHRAGRCVRRCRARYANRVGTRRRLRVRARTCAPRAGRCWSEGPARVTGG